ncbi:hypothetical protein B0H10DRAFT_2185857 [Mycena sp. CBHHK59/15]|nr:hypothetical protein B0H10DRAFT_2185857 [Mycena sp. CBHHK59/15]
MMTLNLMCWNTGLPTFEISTYTSPLYARFSAMASPPSTDRPFPIAHSLGFTHPNKTVIHPQIDHTISRYLYAHVTPPGPSAILPRNYGGHTLSGPKFNTGKTNEQFLGQSFQFCFPNEHRHCSKRYHPISAPPARLLEQHPVLQHLLLARREVAPTPRTSSSPSTTAFHSSPASSSTPRRRRTRFGPPVTPESPLSHVRHARPSVVVSPVRAIPSSVLDNLVSDMAGPSRSEVTTTLDASSNIIQATTSTSTSAPTALPSLHFEYSWEASHVSVVSSEVEMVPLYPFPQILQRRTLPEHVLDISVPFPTVYARDGSIISISSDSSDQTTSAVGELGYPPDVTDEGPVVMDLLSPADGPVHRLTVYPWYREGGASWLMLRDYRRTLAKIGFDTHQMGELFLPHSKIWIPYPSHLPFPVTQSNTLVFIRPVGLSTGSPDDALDALF